MNNFFNINKFIEMWIKPKGIRRIISLILIIILQLIVTAIVYKTGGTRNVYLHLMYFPLFIGCLSYGLVGGIFFALTAGFFLGPFMPINVSTGEMQLIHNWALRIVFFVIIGILTGIVSEILLKYLKHLNEISFFHPITKIRNRRYFEKIHLDDKSNYFLMLLKIENYSKALHNFGYEFANDILIEFSKVIKEGATEFNVFEFYHFSDSEFAILISENEDQNAFYKLSNIIRKTIKLKDVEFYPEISLGVSKYSENNLELIKKAEMARQFAKKNLLDFYLFIPDVSDQDLNNFELFSEIPRAIKDSEFFLVLQPKIDLNNMELEGAEALIRWGHPTKGVVRPDEFIPYLETTNFINKITQWVSKETFKIHNNLLKEGINITISINVPLKYINNPVFFSSLKGLKALGYPLEKLEIEVLERDFVEDFDEVSSSMLKIKELGIKFSLDDFGTGYSSISYIKKLPFDKVKIDKMFVLDIDTNEVNRDIVRSSIELAHLLNNKTVCEGVESIDSLNILKNLGSDYAQGYHIAKPMKVEDFISWYKKNNY